MLLVGNLNYWLDTFEKLLVGNFPETFGWKLSRNFLLETFTIGWKLPETFEKLSVENLMKLLV